MSLTLAAALTARAFALPVIRALPDGQGEGREPELGWRSLLAFYVLLALTALLNLSSQPILSTELARAPDHLRSLAVWPVITGFAFSPLRQLWFTRVAGIDPDLVELARIPLRIMISIPALDTVLAWLRGLRVKARRTPVLTQAVEVNLVVLSTTMFVGSRVLPLPGVVIAALSFALAFAAEAAYLRLRQGGSGLDLVVSS